MTVFTLFTAGVARGPVVQAEVSGFAIHRLLVDEASTKDWIGTTLDWQAKAYTTLDGPAKALEPKLPGWQRVGQFENHTKKNICKHFGK